MAPSMWFKFHLALAVGLVQLFAWVPIPAIAQGQSPPSSPPQRTIRYVLGPYGSPRSPSAITNEYTCADSRPVDRLIVYHDSTNAVTGLVLRCNDNRSSQRLGVLAADNTTLAVPTNSSIFGSLLVRALPDKVTQIALGDDGNPATTVGLNNGSIVLDPRNTTLNFAISEGDCVFTGISLVPKVSPPSIDSLLLYLNCVKPVNLLVSVNDPSVFGVPPLASPNPAETQSPAPPAESPGSAVPNASTIAFVVLGIVGGIVVLALVIGCCMHKRRRDRAELISKPMPPSTYNDEAVMASAGYYTATRTVVDEYAPYPGEPVSPPGYTSPTPPPRVADALGGHLSIAPSMSVSDQSYRTQDYRYTESAGRAIPPSPTAFTPSEMEYNITIQRQQHQQHALLSSPKPTTRTPRVSAPTSSITSSTDDFHYDPNPAPTPRHTSLDRGLQVTVRPSMTRLDRIDEHASLDRTRTSYGSASSHGPPRSPTTADIPLPPMPPPQGPPPTHPRSSLRRGSDATSIAGEIGHPDPAAAAAAAVSMASDPRLPPTVTPITIAGPRLAAAAFSSTADDEVSVSKGDVLLVHAIYSDGWCYVTNRNTGEKGLVPITIVDAQVATDFGLIQMQQAVVMKGMLQAVTTTLERGGDDARATATRSMLIPDR